MTTAVQSASVRGIEGFTVEVCVEVVPSDRSDFRVFGLSEAAARECRVRVKCAIEHAVLGVLGAPPRITVEVLPVDVHKDAAAFDLPVAVGILAENGLVPRESLEGCVFLGELALDGALRCVAGSLPVALHARACGVRALVLPFGCASEAASVSGLTVYAAHTLSEVVSHLRGESVLMEAPCRPVGSAGTVSDLDLSEVRGLEVPRRALEVVAAGGHNLLFIGPPGSGKSVLARCLPGILPPMNVHEALEATAIYSAAGRLGGASLLGSRPFRAPHHDVSVAGLVGGGPVPRPGEVSLAHRGVLFLDELPEFKRDALEALRQPVEDRCVTIVRARAALTYPAAFAFVAAMNPCPCGYRGSPLRGCVCSDDRVKRYFGRLSTPLLDRVDIHAEVQHVDYRTLRGERTGESSADVRERVTAAREAQCHRLAGTGRTTNAEMGPRQVREHCVLDAASDRLLDSAAKRYALSGRVVHQILCVARTVADLAGRGRITSSDIAEAVALRALDRQVS